jgi:hypothetical protein
VTGHQSWRDRCTTIGRRFPFADKRLIGFSFFSLVKIPLQVEVT